MTGSNDPIGDVEKRTGNHEDSGARRAAIVATIAGLIVGTIIVVAGIAFMTTITQPKLPSLKDVWVREIIVLLDHTESENYRNDDRPFREAKEAVKRDLLPAIGPGDRVSCYSIGSDFVETENRVFEARDVPPMVDALLDPSRAWMVPRATVTALSRRVEQAIAAPKTGLAARVDALAQQKKGWTDYLAALRYVGERLTSAKNDDVQERFVIVFGDLQQNPRPSPFAPPAPDAAEAHAFAGVQVVLVEPYRSVHGVNLIVRQRTLAYWRAYFAARGNTTVSMRTLGSAGVLVPPSVVSQASRSANSPS